MIDAWTDASFANLSKSYLGVEKLGHGQTAHLLHRRVKRRKQAERGGADGRG